MVDFWIFRKPYFLCIFFLSRIFRLSPNSECLGVLDNFSSWYTGCRPGRVRVVVPRGAPAGAPELSPVLLSPVVLPHFAVGGHFAPVSLFRCRARCFCCFRLRLGGPSGPQAKIKKQNKIKTPPAFPRHTKDIGRRMGR